MYMNQVLSCSGVSQRTTERACSVNSRLCVLGETTHLWGGG